MNNIKKSLDVDRREFLNNNNGKEMLKRLANPHARGPN